MVKWAKAKGFLSSTDDWLLACHLKTVDDVQECWHNCSEKNDNKNGNYKTCCQFEARLLFDLRINACSD